MNLVSCLVYSSSQILPTSLSIFKWILCLKKKLNKKTSRQKQWQNETKSYEENGFIVQDEAHNQSITGETDCHCPLSDWSSCWLYWSAEEVYSGVGRRSCLIVALVWFSCTPIEEGISAVSKGTGFLSIISDPIILRLQWACCHFSYSCSKNCY